jgi:serine/threonine protein phosphatase PrpC
MRLAVGSRTDIGRARKRNEDSFLVREPLFAVADGMGGHRGGNVASAMAVEALGRIDPAGMSSDAILRAIETANHDILQRGDAERDLEGMGTTVTALLIDGEGGRIAHVGDSRAYRLRGGDLIQLTEDHTVVQEFVRQGRLSREDAERHPQRSMLMRALGVDDEVQIEDLAVDLRPGDRFLLCSDGLTGMLSEDGIALVLGTTPDPQDAADRLVALANEAGGDDNITVIVVDVLDADGGPATASGSDPNRTQVTPAVTVDPSAPVSTTPSEARAGPGVKGKRRGRRRVVVAVLLVLLVAGLVGGFVGVRSFLNGQWYVGTAGDRVAVFQGIPASVLGVRLAHVRTVTPLRASEALRMQGWETLREGITAKSEREADAIVERIRMDLCRSTTSTCVPEPVR